MAVLGLIYLVNLRFPRKSSRLLKIRVVTTCVGGKHLVGKRVDASSAETFQPHCSFGSYQQSPSTTSLFLIPMISHSLSLSLSLGISPIHKCTLTHPLTHTCKHTPMYSHSHTHAQIFQRVSLIQLALTAPTAFSLTFVLSLLCGRALRAANIEAHLRGFVGFFH